MDTSSFSKTYSNTELTPAIDTVETSTPIIAETTWKIVTYPV